MRPEQLATVQSILARYVPECEVRAFGSRVTGKTKPYSDLDLAVLGEAPAGPETFRLLREALEESELSFRVDVLDWNEVSAGFRLVIERQYELLQPGRDRAVSNTES